MRREVQGFDSAITVSAVMATDRTVSKECDTDWFPKIVKQLCPSDAGLQLAVFTGAEERTCYRYAAGHTKTSGDFIRTLLRSEQGEPFFHALMDGCKASWWLAHQRRLRNGDRAERAGFE